MKKIAKFDKEIIATVCGSFRRGNLFNEPFDFCILDRDQSLISFFFPFQVKIRQTGVTVSGTFWLLTSLAAECAKL